MYRLNWIELIGLFFYTQKLISPFFNELDLTMWHVTSFTVHISTIDVFHNNACTFIIYYYTFFFSLLYVHVIIVHISTSRWQQYFSLHCACVCVCVSVQWKLTSGGYSFSSSISVLQDPAGQNNNGQCFNVEQWFNVFVFMIDLCVKLEYS